MLVKVGVFLVTDRFFIPTAFFKPSVKAWSGLWHEAQEIEESLDKILSKKSFFPKCILSLVSLLSSGIWRLGKPLGMVRKYQM